MGSKTDNPIPEHSSDRKLANEFLDASWRKLQFIMTLKTHLNFANLLNNPKFKFTEFSTLSEDDVRKIIMLIETTSCESDILPTFFLKNQLDKLLQSLTNIVNLSLQNGISADEWKIAILRQLIKKKQNSDLVTSNYKPVSNIPSLAKVVENITLTQLNEFFK